MSLELQPLKPHGRHEITTDRLTRAAELLDDGCSVLEVARTLGMCRKTITRYFPGSAWTPTQRAQFAAQVAHINRTTPWQRRAS